MSARRASLLLAPAVALALVAAPAVAQVIGRPIEGAFEEIYLVNGRVVDEEGWPMNQLFVEITIRDLKGVTFKPLRVGTNCFGDFQGYFPIRRLEDRKATVEVRVLTPDPGPPGAVDFGASQPFDSFFRRSDFVLKAPYAWPAECQDARDYWPVRATVWGRVIKGEPGATLNGTLTDATPVKFWPVDLNVTLPDDTRHRPPEVVPTDTRGDFKYSFTFAAPMTEAEMIVGVTAKHANGTHDLGVDNVRMEVPYDGLARVAFAKINVGEPQPRAVPVPPATAALALVLAAAVALALAGRRRTA